MAAIVSTAFTAIACLFTVLRCYTRFLIIRKPQLDDALVIFAAFTSISQTVMIWEEQRSGLGEDLENVSLDNLSRFLKAFWAVVMCFCLGIMTVKCSAILQCMRFIVMGKMRIFCWLLLINVIVGGILAVFVNTFRCTPVAAFWDLTIPDRKCLDVMGFWYIGSAMIALTDILVVAVPIYTVKGMVMPRRQKVALIVVFGLGGLACIASIVRFYLSIVLGKSGNITKYSWDAAMWTAIELNVGIICVNIPPLKPLAIAVAPFFVMNRQQRAAHDPALPGHAEAVVQDRPRRRGTLDDLEMMSSVDLDADLTLKG